MLGCYVGVNLIFYFASTSTNPFLVFFSSLLSDDVSEAYDYDSVFIPAAIPSTLAPSSAPSAPTLPVTAVPTETPTASASPTIAPTGLVS